MTRVWNWCKLQFYGFRDNISGRYHISASLTSPFIDNQQVSLPFLIDSGSSLTFISYIAARMVGVKYDKLPPSSLDQMINGNLPAVTLPIGAILFTMPGNKTVINEILTNIYVHRPVITNEQDEVNASMLLPILGMDFLGRYRLTLQNDFCILERWEISISGCDLTIS